MLRNRKRCSWPNILWDVWILLAFNWVTLLCWLGVQHRLTNSLFLSLEVSKSVSLTRWELRRFLKASFSFSFGNQPESERKLALTSEKDHRESNQLRKQWLCVRGGNLFSWTFKRLETSFRQAVNSLRGVERKQVYSLQFWQSRRQNRVLFPLQLPGVGWSTKSGLGKAGFRVRSMDADGLDTVFFSLFFLLFFWQFFLSWYVWLSDQSSYLNVVAFHHSTASVLSTFSCYSPFRKSSFRTKIESSALSSLLSNMLIKNAVIQLQLMEGWWWCVLCEGGALTWKVPVKKKTQGSDGSSLVNGSAISSSSCCSLMVK